MDEARLIDKLRRIEALFAGAATEGEKVAAERARSRILERLKLWEQEDPPVEYRFSMSDMWSRSAYSYAISRNDEYKDLTFCDGFVRLWLSSLTCWLWISSFSQRKKAWE